MKKSLAITIVVALILTMIPLASWAEGSLKPPQLQYSSEVYKGIPTEITVSPQVLMYNTTNTIKIFAFKGAVSVSDFKSGAAGTPLKTFSYTYTDTSQKKTFSYSPTVTGTVTLIAVHYVGTITEDTKYAEAGAYSMSVKKASSLETISVISPSGFSKSIKDKPVNACFYCSKYYEGVTNKVKVTIKRGSTTVKTKEYKLDSDDLYASKSFKYTPSKTGTYKFIYTTYVNGTKCKTTTKEFKVINSSAIKDVTPSISYLYYDRAKAPKSVEVGLKGINGAAKIKVYRSKTKTGKYTLVKTASLNGGFYTTAKYSSTYPYYKIKVTSGNYTSKFSAPVKITPMGKVKNVKVTETSETGYYGGNKYQYMKVSWSKLEGATGYVVFYKKDGKMRYIGSTNTTSCTVYPLYLYEIESSTNIYVQAIKETSNTYSYGYYSDGVKLTVKKLN